MVLISELPDDGSHGGDPNKNPKELQKNPPEDDENQNKNPQEDDDDDPQEDDDENPQEDDDDDPQEDDDENPQEHDDENPQEDDDENPQEAENLPDALQLPQEQVDQVENLLNALQLPQDQVENLRNILQLPHDLMEIIVAPVRRCDYPALILTSRAFRQFMESEGLYNKRIYSGLTESILYVLIGFRPGPYFEYPRWYILYRNIPRNITLHLGLLSSIPLMFPGSAVVTIGHNMYVMGGCLNPIHPTASVYLIDCRFHTCVPLPNMHMARCRPAAGVIDGKIYVIGGCERRYADWVEVFDVRTRIWTTVPGWYPKALSFKGEIAAYVVIQEKMYILDSDLCCLTYEPTSPTQGHWETESQLQNYWRGWSSCVIDHLLYTFDPYRILGHVIVVYDPNDKIWRPVKGKYDLPDFVYFDTRMANFNGKLTIVGPTPSYRVYCIEIALEEREGNEIWGKVVSRALVLKFNKMPYIELCRSVRV